MIPARDTKSRWVVSLRDEALRDVDRKLIREYAETRDISVLNIDTKSGITESGESVTLFKIEPLKQFMANLADPDARTNLNLTAVFAAHVSDIRNGPVDMQRENDRLSDDFVNSIPIDIRIEIATVVIELATGGGRGATVPFSLPAGYWVERSLSQDLTARIAAKLRSASAENGTSKTTRESVQEG